MRRILAVTAAFVAALSAALPAAAQWKPDRPITIIVPWAAGGSTDQVTRITAGEMEKALGQKVVIVNQPGASGSIGTQSVLNAPKDGYTWASGAAQDLGVYRTLGMIDTNLADWHLFLSVANVPVVGVNANAPYQNVTQLLDAMKAKPGQVSVATAGVTSSGHKAMEAISRATGVKYRHVTYEGGAPAVVATVAGEVDVTTQLAVEQADMIRAKRIRPLATVSEQAIEIEGYGRIEPITQALPAFRAPANYFGIFIPKSVPPEVVQTVTRIWDEQISKSEALKKYASSRGAFFGPASGDAAVKAVMPAVRENAWILFESGKAKVSPDTVGIPKP